MLLYPYNRAGFHLRWEYFVNIFGDVTLNQHASFVAKFTNAVSIFQDKVNMLLGFHHQILELIDELKKTNYSQENFHRVLTRIQEVVDKLALESYSNLDNWVLALNEKIEAVLLERMQGAIQGWMTVFTSDYSDGDTIIPFPGGSRSRAKRVQRHISPETKSAETSQSNTASPRLSILLHEMKIKNQLMYLDPPLECARMEWIRQLHEWLGVVSFQNRITSGRFNLTLNARSDPDQVTFRSLVGFGELLFY